MIKNREAQSSIGWNSTSKRFNVFITFQQDGFEYSCDVRNRKVSISFNFETSEDSPPEVLEEKPLKTPESKPSSYDNIFQKHLKDQSSISENTTFNKPVNYSPKKVLITYDNVNDLCIGKSLLPLRLKNVSLGLNYLVPTIQLFKPKSNETAEDYIQALVGSIFDVRLTIFKMNDLIFNIPLESYSYLADSTLAIVRTFSKVLQNRFYIQNKVRSSLSIQIPVDFELDWYNTPPFKAKIKNLAQYCKKLLDWGADIIFLDFVIPSESYLKALKMMELKKALELLWSFYNKCTFFAYHFFIEPLKQGDLNYKVVAFKTPKWVIPEWVPENVSSIYKPMVAVILAKILILPSLLFQPNCFLFGFGEGAVAKAMTGSPLIIPNPYESKELWAYSFAISDSISTQFFRTEPKETSKILQSTHSIISYFNMKHENEGFSENQNTRDNLIASCDNTTPLHFLIRYPDVFYTAREILSDNSFDTIGNALTRLIEKIVDALEQKIITISKEEENILMKLLKDFS